MFTEFELLILPTSIREALARISEDTAPTNLRLCHYCTKEGDIYLFDEDAASQEVGQHPLPLAREYQLIAEIEQIMDLDDDDKRIEWIDKTAKEIDNNWSPLNTVDLTKEESHDSF